MALNIDGVVVVNGPLVVASAAEVDALESKLWIRFPSGYREYMERLGEGILGGTLVRIFPPWQMEKQIVEWRRHMQKYWFWNESLELLPMERAVECVTIGDTMNGDRLIFHPCRPDRLFALPIDFERVFEVGSDLLEAIEWLCSSGQLTEPFPERVFEPFNNRIVEGDIDRAGREVDKVIDPKGESLDDIVELGRRWVERHSAREWSQIHLDALEEHFGKGATTELIFDGIVLTEDVLTSNNYVLKYSVMDAQCKSKLGVFQINHSAYSHGYSIEEVHHSRKYKRPRSQRTRPPKRQDPIKEEEPKEA